jgi:hypothetical protein
MESSTTDKRSASDSNTIQRLQDEITALRAELQALRSVTKFQTSQQDSEQTFDFLGFPRELRNAVYELCVVVGEVRIVRPHQLQPLDMRYKRPRDARAEVQLFGVNKQVQREALEIYLSKNHFVIPAADFSSGYTGYMYTDIAYPFGCIPGRYLHGHLRSISIALDKRESISGIVDDHETSIDYHHQHDPPEEVSLVLDRHNCCSTELEESFVSLMLLATQSNLQKIQINVEHTSCISGCHRLVVVVFENGSVKDDLESYAESKHHIKSLDFLGTVNSKERHAIRSAFPQSLRGKITFHGQWHFSHETWNPDVEVFDETPIEQVSPSDT